MVCGYNYLTMHTKLFKQTFLLFCVIAILKFVGDMLYLFDSLWWYDIVLHFLGGGLVAMAVFVIWNIFKLPILKNNTMVFFVIIFSLIMSVLWEYYELYFGLTTLSDGLVYRFDTTKDLIMDILGIFCGIFYSFKLKNE